MTTKKTATAKKGAKSSVSKNPTQIIRQTINAQKCPQKSSENNDLDTLYTQELLKTQEMAEKLEQEVKASKEMEAIEWNIKDTIKDTILRLRYRYASRTFLSAEEFKNALTEIENAIK